MKMLLKSTFFTPVVLILLGALALAYLQPTAHAQTSCGAFTIEVLGGSTSPFILPQDADKTLQVAPEGSLNILVRNPPPSGILEVKLTGVPEGLAVQRYPIQGTGPVVEVLNVPVKDYNRWGRGIYQVQLALLESSGAPLCSAITQVQITGFGGILGYGSVAATIVTGLGVIANVIGNIKNSLEARIKVSVAAGRRRRRGLRRWIPIPSPWKTIKGTVIGTVSGVAVVLLLQQGGITPLSLRAALSGLVIGGLAPVTVSVSLGSLIGFLVPPKEKPPKQPQEGVA